jgi:hypothetical protein
MIDKSVCQALVLDISRIDKACLSWAVVKYDLVAREPVTFNEDHRGGQHVGGVSLMTHKLFRAFGCGLVFTPRI